MDDNNNNFDQNKDNQNPDFQNESNQYTDNYNPPDYSSQPSQEYYNQPDKGKTPGMAIASLVCGIVSLFIFGAILGTLAIVFGVLGRNANRAKTGMATAGLILGIIGVAGWFVITGGRYFF